MARCQFENVLVVSCTCQSLHAKIIKITVYNVNGIAHNDNPQYPTAISISTIESFYTLHVL